MTIKTNGVFRSHGKPFTDQTASYSVTGIMYEFVVMNEDLTFYKAYYPEFDFDFIAYLKTRDDEQKKGLFGGVYEFEAASKIKLTMKLPGLEKYTTYYYTILAADKLQNEQGDVLEFIPAGS